MRIHALTTEQLHKLSDALGDGSDWPKHTNDPKVNYAVDCVVQLRSGLEPIPPYRVLRKTYLDEIEASFKRAGLGPAI